MDPEQINQIIETIKTLNLNLDSATLVQVVEEIRPILWFWLIKGMILDIFTGIIVLACVYFISKAVLTYWKKKSSE